MPANNSKTTMLLAAGRAVMPDALNENVVLAIEDGRIQKISRRSTGGHTGEFGLGDATLYPGFIDIHIHGSFGIDLLTASAADLHSVSKYLSEKGVTAWMPTLVPAPAEQYQSAIKAIDQVLDDQTNEGAAFPNARVLGVHYEGPFVNAAKCGALHREHFQDFSSKNELDTLPVPKKGLRLMTMAPEIPGGIDLVRALTERKWITSIGHTNAGIELLDKAYDAGARHMTHFMNAMAPFDHRSPGPIAWGLSRDDVSCDFIADGIHLHPFVLQLLSRLKSTESLVLISDAIAAAGKGDGQFDIWGEAITVKDGRTSNAQGSIAGSVISMLDAVLKLLSLGASEVEVARMAATNPARLLGIAGDTGSIEEGKRADLVALDAAGNVLMTMVAGEIVFQR